MSIAFFTGFPGFLGSALLPKVLEQSPAQRAVCLIQSKFIGQARSLYLREYPGGSRREWPACASPAELR